MFLLIFKIRLPPRVHEIIGGKAVVVFTKEEHELLVDTCRWTTIGKFSRGRPAIGRIRSNFTKVITTKGEVKIGAKDRYHVFIDVENEEDFNDIFSRDSIALNDDVDMKILKWTPNFKPNAENSLAPVWINLLNLPWHYYEWDALCRIVDPIEVPLIMDKATTTKTRPTTAKLRVQIDLAKPLIYIVRVEVRNLSGEEETFDQKIEYETLPIYCSHCKVQNHSTKNYKVVHTGTTKVREQQSNKEEKRKEDVDTHAKRGSQSLQRQQKHRSIEQQNGSNTMPIEESSNPTKNKDEGWHNVVKRRGKEIDSKETPNGKKFTIDNNTTKVTNNFFNILQDKENGDMKDAEPSQVNLEEHDTSANQQNQVRSSRWDKAQKEKEGKASKRHQPKLSVRSTRSRNATSITNPEAELQGEILSLFTGEVSIPKEVTLQGEFRDDDGIIREKKADQLTKWASLTNKMRTREDTISQGAN
ncbi:hypothetical protein H5410_055951 [Solanum commersonii]|uniref:DUF4283 domain-containing protein n=1 Tax=Solanum commersonii TaxID=4109 RepID=A0A9J5WIY8_SOLCO|nr:hypothetical protein H5410_055951 [Solanum commersonii]